MTESIAKSLEIASTLCRKFEGFSSKPYICPAGYPTIGYGTVYKLDGQKVTMNDQPISKETAEEWLLNELKNNYMAGVLRASPNLITNPNALAAMTDFAYNLGVGRYRGSTLRRKINDQNWNAAKTELAKWIRGGGKVLPGLIKRRAEEARLF